MARPSPAGTIRRKSASAAAEQRRREVRRIERADHAYDATLRRTVRWAVQHVRAGGGEDALVELIAVAERMPPKPPGYVEHLTTCLRRGSPGWSRKNRVNFTGGCEVRS